MQLFRSRAQGNILTCNSFRFQVCTKPYTNWLAKSYKQHMLILLLKLFNSQTNRLCYLPVQHLGDPWGSCMVAHHKLLWSWSATRHRTIRSCFRSGVSSNSWKPTANDGQEIEWMTYRRNMCIKLRIQFSQALSVYTCEIMRIAYLITYHLHSWSIVVIRVCVISVRVLASHHFNLNVQLRQLLTPSPSFAVETPSRYPPSMAMEFDNCSQRYARSN